MSAFDRISHCYGVTLASHLHRPPRSCGTDGLTLIEYTMPPGSLDERSAIGLFAVHLAVAGGTRLRRRVNAAWEAADLGVGSLTLSPPGHWSRAEWDGTQRRFSMYVTEQRFAALAGLDIARDASALHADLDLIDPALRLTLEALRAKFWDAAPRAYDLAIEGLASAACVDLANRHSTLRPNPYRCRGGLAPRQLRRACDAMDAGIAGHVGLEVIARIAGCSPTHFSRAFKQSTGLPPFAWLLQRRIERAKQLLADPSLSLVEIALATGFAAQPQFTTAFRRVTGATPGAWRRERLR